MSICSVCGENVPNLGAKIVRGKSGQWVCKQCLNKAGVGSIQFSNTFITSDQIESLINKRNSNFANEHKSVAILSENVAMYHQKKKSSKNIAIIVSICVVVFALIMGILFGEEEPAVNASSQESITYIEVTADELYLAYDNNEVAADEAYKGKYVKVTGVVTEISSSGTFTQACILLNAESSYFLGDVQCNFSDDAVAKKIAEINKGQTVTVKGKCAGFKDINIEISNCEIE